MVGLYYVVPYEWQVALKHAVCACRIISVIEQKKGGRPSNKLILSSLEGPEGVGVGGGSGAHKWCAKAP